MKATNIVVMIVAGLLLGGILIAVLPKAQPAALRGNPQVIERLRRTPWVHPPPSATVPGPKPAVTEHTPWILIGIGLGLAVLFRKDVPLVTMGGTFTTAGITALLGTHLT